MLWTSGGATILDGPTGAYRDEAHVITDDGLILGPDWYLPTDGDARDGETHAVVYSATGPAIDLGTLGGLYSEAFDINNSGQVVGTSYLDKVTSKPAAFLHENGAMTDLNALIPPNSGWDLQTAFSITGDGTIMGIGTLNGTPTGFLLTVPEPASATAIASLCVAFIRRQKRRTIF